MVEVPKSPSTIRDQIALAIANRNVKPKPPTNAHHYDYDKTKAAAAGKPSGVLQYGHWSPSGKNHVIRTPHSIGKNAREADQFPTFLSELGPMFAVMGLAFSVIDHRMYDRYRASFQKYVGDQPHRQTFVPVDNMAWLTFTHVVNLRSLPHVDKLDDAEGWRGMTSVGNYEGGDLILPDYNIRIEFNAGDLCLIRSRVIRHAIGPFTGERSALVLFTHERDLGLEMGIEPDVNARDRKSVV